MAPYVDFHTHFGRGNALEILSVNLLDEAAVRAAIDSVQPFSLGVHPWHAVAEEGVLREAFVRLEESARSANLVAIGECGLDFAVEVDREAQMTVFREQLRLAGRLNLPTVLHCVRAFEPTVAQLVAARSERAVFHSFIGSPQQAAKVVSKGWCCSFSPRSLASSRTREVIGQIPSSALFIESDESEQPISEIYAEVAALRGCTVEELREVVFENYKRLIQ